VTPSRRRRRRPLIVGALAAFGVLVAALAVILLRGSATASMGPLSTTNINIISVNAPVAASEPITWGTFIPTNPTNQPITILSVNPIEPTGVEVIQIGINNPDTEGPVGALRGFPQPGITVHPVAGAILQPVGSQSPYLQIIVGVRLAAGSSHGTINGLKVTYEAAGQTFQLVLPGTITLDLGAPGSSV